MVPLNPILQEIADERRRQNEKWGGFEHDRNHSTYDWVALLTKHAGISLVEPFDSESFRTQMVRVAAIAVAAVQTIDTLCLNDILGEDL